MRNAISSFANCQEWLNPLKQRVQSASNLKFCPTFYIAQTSEQCWSRDVLSLPLKSRLHERAGKALTNFSCILPAPQSCHQARQTLRKSYNDSRTSAACKVRRKHEFLRVKGGIHDYCITGEIDVQALRLFQSSHRSPEKPIKPMSDGFEIDFGRNALPTGEKE